MILGMRSKQLVIGLFLAMMLASTALTFLMQRHVDESRKWADHSLLVLEAGNGLVVNMFEADSSARAYIMTGEKANLENYREVTPKITASTIWLRDLVAEEAGQTLRLRNLTPLIESKIGAMSEMINSYEAAGFADETTRVWLRRGLYFTGRINLLTSEVIKEEQNRYQLHHTEQLASASRLKLAIAYSGFLGIAIALVFFYRLLVERQRLNAANVELRNINARVEARVKERTDELGQVVVKLQDEVATRAKAEEFARRTQTFMDVVMTHIPTAVILFDAETLKINLANRAAEELIGRPSGEIIGKTSRDLYPGERGEAYTTRQREVLQLGKLMETETEEFSTHHSGTRALRTTHIPVPGENGQPRFLLVLSEDVTERRAVETQLRTAQKMEAIGDLTGDMAHDFNNLLSIIIGNLDFMRAQIEGGALDRHEIMDMSSEALSAALRGADLTQRLLVFARRQPLQPRLIELNELIPGITKLVGRTLGADIEIELDLAADARPVVADPAQLESSIVNIINNARDAMPLGGTLRIATANRLLDPDHAMAHDGIVPGSYTAIEISDTGTGMRAEVSAQIFEPFFTTKEQGKGTGLGLSMVFGFIKQSKGHVNVYSEPGRGTTIRLFLPSAAAAEQADGAEEGGALMVGGDEAILVVEDNAGLRRVVARQVKSLGYNFLEAESGADAISILEREKVDLVFSDIVMPGGMSGFGLAKTVKLRWPSVKVLLTSGFPDTKFEDIGDMPQKLRLLTKPYRKEDLAKALREALDAV